MIIYTNNYIKVSIIMSAVPKMAVFRNFALEFLPEMSSKYVRKII